MLHGRWTSHLWRWATVIHRRSHHRRTSIVHRCGCPRVKSSSHVSVIAESPRVVTSWTAVHGCSTIIHRRSHHRRTSIVHHCWCLRVKSSSHVSILAASHLMPHRFSRIKPLSSHAIVCAGAHLMQVLAGRASRAHAALKVATIIRLPRRRGHCERWGFLTMQKFAGRSPRALTSLEVFTYLGRTRRWKSHRCRGRCVGAKLCDVATLTAFRAEKTRERCDRWSNDARALRTRVRSPPWSARTTFDDESLHGGSVEKSSAGRDADAWYCSCLVLLLIVVIVLLLLVCAAIPRCLGSRQLVHVPATKSVRGEVLAERPIHRVRFRMRRRTGDTRSLAAP